MAVIKAGHIFGIAFSIFGFRSGNIIFNEPVTIIWEYCDIRQIWFPIPLHDAGTNIWIPQILFSLQVVRVGISAVSKNDIIYHLELTSYDNDTRIIDPCCELFTK